MATSARATLGGMIANNSSGSHTPVYGTTADHISELEIVLADSRAVAVGPGHDTLRKQRELVSDLVYFHGLTIAERLPPGLLKRWPGYGIDRCVREPDNLNHLLCGSEGTLAAITSAELKIVPLPEAEGPGPDLLRLGGRGHAGRQWSCSTSNPPPSNTSTGCCSTRPGGNVEFQAARDLLELEFKPCQSILAVEFFDEVEDSWPRWRSANWACAR